MTTKLPKCIRIIKSKGHFLYSSVSMYEKILLDADIYNIVINGTCNKIQKHIHIIKNAIYKYENSNQITMNNKKQCKFLIDAIETAQSVRNRMCMWLGSHGINSILKFMCIKLKYTKQFIQCSQYDFKWLNWMQSIQNNIDNIQQLTNLSDYINNINNDYLLTMDEIIYTDVRPIYLRIIYEHESIGKIIGNIYNTVYSKTQQSGLMYKLLFNTDKLSEVLCYIVLQYANPFNLENIVRDMLLD